VNLRFGEGERAALVFGGKWLLPILVYYNAVHLDIT
jgi:hypothetical protein